MWAVFVEVSPSLYLGWVVFILCGFVCFDLLGVGEGYMVGGFSTAVPSR